jgi:hypothetical protein
VSITIEVTGNSIPEVADKLLAIGASLQNPKATQPAFSWFDAEPEHDRVTPNEHARDFIRKLSAQIAAEEAKAAPVDPTPAPKSAPAAEATESQPTTEEPSSTPAPATLDYKTEVAPFVLKLVEVSGKPAAQRVLDQFGVVKASHISPERWPELVAMIKAEMGQ